MTLKGSILILLTILMLLAAVSVTAQRKGAAAKRGRRPALEAQRAYENKCMSCHRETRKYPEGKQAAALRHMRVRADLTEKETQAILRYLTQ